MEIIKCKICGKDFEPKNNVQIYCSSKCFEIRRKEYFKTDKIKEKQKIYKQEHRNKCKEYEAKYRYKNENIINIRISNWRENNKERNNEIQKKASKKYRDKMPDSYIKKFIPNNSPRELIDFTREHIRLKRLIKEIQAN